jgi:TRAP-type mannitol/chloroaromatic compound transport system permease small subunit
MSAVLAACRIFEQANRAIGKTVAWLVLAMALIQFALVMLRYVYGTGSLFMQEAVIYAHGILFMAAAAWTLSEDKHVRVDIFYGTSTPRRKAMIDLFGVVFFLLPMCWLIWQLGYPYVARSWAVLEGSRETSGIPAIFVLKTFILVFTVSVAIQGVILAVRSMLVLLGRAEDNFVRSEG